jgi:hypothetical protein
MPACAILRSSSASVKLQFFRGIHKLAAWLGIPTRSPAPCVWQTGRGNTAAAKLAYAPFAPIIEHVRGMDSERRLSALPGGFASNRDDMSRLWSAVGRFVARRHSGATDRPSVGRAGDDLSGDGDSRIALVVDQSRIFDADEGRLDDYHHPLHRVAILAVLSRDGLVDREHGGKLAADVLTTSSNS